MEVDQPRAPSVEADRLQAPSPDRHVYYWRQNPYSPWIAYEVTTLRGRRLVMGWISLHADALERSKEHSLIAWIPRDVLVEHLPDSSAHEHLLMMKYLPRGADAERGHVVIFASEDIEALRELFREHGTQVRAPGDPLAYETGEGR